jgi:hypothetical protein
MKRGTSSRGFLACGDKMWKFPANHFLQPRSSTSPHQHHHIRLSCRHRPHSYRADLRLLLPLSSASAMAWSVFQLSNPHCCRTPNKTPQPQSQDSPHSRLEDPLFPPSPTPYGTHTFHWAGNCAEVVIPTSRQGVRRPGRES